MIEPIKIWRYKDAPAELQVSTNGGDEDWLAEVPPHVAEDYIPWLEDESFGCCARDTYPHPDPVKREMGWDIVVGSHA